MVLDTPRVSLMSEHWAGVTGTFTGSQPGRVDGPETAHAGKTRCGCYRSDQGTKEGQRGWGRGGSVAAAPGRRWHRCEGPAGSGPSHLRGGAVAGAPWCSVWAWRAVGRGHQGGGAAEFRPAPARAAGEGAGRRWSREGASRGAPGGRSWALERGSRSLRFTPLPAAPSPPGAPAEAGRGPQQCCAPTKLSATSVLYYDSNNAGSAQAPQHGGPRLRLPLRPRLHRPASAGAGARRPPNAVTAQAETSPSAVPAQGRAAARAPSLPTSCQGLVLPGPLPHRVPDVGGTQVIQQGVLPPAPSPEAQMPVLWG